MKKNTYLTEANGKTFTSIKKACQFYNIKYNAVFMFYKRNYGLTAANFTHSNINFTITKED